jgi:hypothetical protein
MSLAKRIRFATSRNVATETIVAGALAIALVFPAPASGQECSEQEVTWGSSDPIHELLHALKPLAR